MTAPPDDLDLRLAVLEATLLERSTAQERALNVAMTANEKRLDTMNEWRATYADLVTNTMSRTEITAALQGIVEQTRGELSSLRDRVAALGAPDYLLWGVVVSALSGLAFGIWLLIGLKIDNATMPLALQVEHLKIQPDRCAAK